MLRGHVGSIKLIRGIVNPSYRRNLSAASTSYAEEKNRKKTKESVFSWLKDIFKYDDRIQEARKASSGDGPVTILDYPVIDRACTLDFKLDRMDDRGSIEDRTWNSNPFNLEEYPKKNRVNYERHRGVSRQDLLVRSEIVDISVRTIMGCASGNTKPPIREPNMPEKQEKKDDKKEKKNKKPVIRMEGGAKDSGENDSSLKTKDSLHDNMDVNLRNQWGVRLPEEAEKLQNMENQRPIDSSFQLPPYEARNLQYSRNIGETMNSQTNEQMEKGGTASSSNLGPGAKSSQSSTVSDLVDDEYNVPPGTKLDAEISAWKELVLRSKVRLSPSNEELVPEDGRRAEMLSIRPEPPRPKLDVQAVPTSNEQPTNEHEDEEFSPDVRAANKGDSGRIGNLTDVQKSDNKKMHTGSIYSMRKDSEHLRASVRPRGFSRVLETVDHGIGFIASQRTLDFSTSTDSSWQKNDQANETEQSQNIRATKPEDKFDHRSSKIVPVENLGEERAANVAGYRESPANFDQRSRKESDFGDSLNRFADREIDISANSSLEENQDIRATRNVDQTNVEHVSRSLSDDFQTSFDYANTPYEDDFYPGYESMSLEPEPEKSISERSHESVERSVSSSNVRSTETYTDLPTDQEYKEQYISDGEYIKVPGDPYPYSREHFYKWRIYEREDSPILNNIDPTLREIHADTSVPPVDGVLDKETDIRDAKNTKNRINASHPSGEKSTTIEIERTAGGIDNFEKSKISSKAKNDFASHVETIQPDIRLSNHELDANASQRYKGNKATSLIQNPEATNLTEGHKLEDIHALRNEQLSSVSKDEIEKIYESKNYVYLRAEEMKNFRSTLSSK